MNLPRYIRYRNGGGPRRNSIPHFSAAEKAIYDAVQEVEKAGAHPYLTDAVVLLGQARDKVADFVDIPDVKFTLGLDFGGVISKAKTTDDLMEGVVEGVGHLRYLFRGGIYIVSRVDSIESRDRVLKYMKAGNLWHKLNIPEKNIRFCLRREDKAPICSDLGITHFVDNRLEVLSHMSTVRNRYALNPMDADDPKYQPLSIARCKDWESVVREIILDISRSTKMA